MQITAEIKQTYDLLKFAIARANGSIFSLWHNTKCPTWTRVKQQKGRETEKKTENVQMPRNVGVVRPVNPILHTDTLFKHVSIDYNKEQIATVAQSLEAQLLQAEHTFEQR